MFKHIVMWKCIDTNEQPREKNAAIIKTQLDALPAKIPQIVEFEVGIDVNRSENAFDVVLYSSFKSIDELKIYSSHPSHVAAAAVIGSLVQKRQVVDYEVI